MRKRSFQLVALVILGSAMNIATAWACILIWLPEIDPENQQWFEGEEAVALINDLFEAGTGVKPGQCAVYKEWRTGWLQVGAGWCPDEDDWDTTIDADALSSGWPMYSLVGHSRHERKHDQYQYALLIPNQLWPYSGGQIVEFLPTCPIWPGFAINTAFYAVILWLLIRGPSALRRYLRARRGHCIKCCYDLQGDLESGCPECGWRRDHETQGAPGVAP